MTVRLAAVAMATIALLFFVAVPASAQKPTRPMTIEFRFAEPDNAGLGKLGVVRAFMGLTECGSVDFAAGDRTLVVGGPGTPEACGQTWRVVNLVPDASSPLWNDPVFEPGTTVTITRTGPFPAIDGPDVPPFFIEVRVDESGATGPTADDLAAYGPLTAYVGGVACGSSVTDDDEGWMLIPVGADGTPDVCRERGAEITLVDGHGNRLVVRPSVGPGPFYALQNLAPEPSHSSGGVPLPAPAGQAPAGADAAPLAPALLGVFALSAAAIGRWSTGCRRVRSRSGHVEGTGGDSKTPRPTGRGV